MMVYLLQNPDFEFPYSCCKLNDGTEFNTKAPEKKDVADWNKCKKEFDESKPNTQLHKEVSVFLKFVSPSQPQQYCQ